MDESGARIGYPGGEYIIVPVEVKEIYTSSPENRKSVTVIEAIRTDGSNPPPPFIIIPGQRIMENWIILELIRKEQIATTPTGYTNNEVALLYLDYLIYYVCTVSSKPWKILLLNSYESHKTDEFQLKAVLNNIYLYYYPSHLIYALQPLNISIFRPWKHYYKLAIQSALRGLDFEYSITSFFRDLISIR
jgi:hypothetical protein